MSAKNTVAAMLISGALLPDAVMAEPKLSHPYVGMWVTDDGHVRHELLANGRYDEARGNRESASIARAVAYAVEQPDDVDVSELIVRPTASPY